MTRRLLVVAAMAFAVATTPAAARSSAAKGPRAATPLHAYCDKIECPSNARTAQTRTTKAAKAGKRQREITRIAKAERLVTVGTAAGITITVSADFAPKIVAFIAANVAAGKKFKHIHCYNHARTHVSGSLHFSGDACDFKPIPIGRLAGDFGLRSGCSFMVGRRGHRRPDCEHIDNAYAFGPPYVAQGSRPRGSSRLARQ